MEHVRTDIDGAVMCLELDRCDKRNALDMPMFDLLARRLADADGRDDIGAVLLCGAGEHFCAGHDLQAFDAWPQRPGDPVPRFLHALAGLRKPLVIAVQGWAVGIGATALLHADCSLAAPAARLRFPFVDLGIAPEAASTLLLSQAVGTLRARRLLMSGCEFSGQQAHDWGLVGELCETADLRALALQRAQALAAKPVAIARLIKHGLRDLPGLHARIDAEIEWTNQAVHNRRKNATP